MNDAKRIRTKSIIIVVIITVLLMLSVLPWDINYSGDIITDKWALSVIAILILIIVASCLFITKQDYVCTTNKTDLIIYPFIICGVFVVVNTIIHIIGQEKVSIIGHNVIIAGFDNPAGVASAFTVSTPFILFYFNRLNNIRISNLLILLFVAVELFIMTIVNSRAGLLSLFSIILLFLFHRKGNKQNRIMTIIIITVIILSIVLGISFLKRGSNSGRGLILRICWNMIKSAPLLGLGLHGFRRQYMLFQADFFEHNSDTLLGMLADNVIHPLNEYVLLAVNFGLIGVILFLSVILFIIRYHFKNPTEESFLGIMILTGIGVLALFSYPLRYPFSSYGILFSLYLIFNNGYYESIFRKKIVIIIVAMMSSIVLILFIRWYRYQMEWNKLSQRTELIIDSGLVLEHYNYLYPKLKNNPYFLYNYAFRLSESEDYEKSLIIAEESFDLMANYETALLLANNAKESKDDYLSEKYYLLASKMCPVRFKPLYGLFKLYEEYDRLDEMKELGKLILSKPIKINSSEIRQIRMNVRYKLAGLDE